jgi:hypothetical protein
VSRLRLNKIATPATPAAGKGELYYSSSLTPNTLAFIDESGNVSRLGGLGTKDYRLVKRLYLYNGTTTYTPTSGVSALHIEALGGSGAGGGAATSTGGTNNSIGAGGGAGGGARLWTTSNVVGAHTVAIGAAGAVGTAGNNAGGNGGNTTFADTTAAVVLQANGGTGGAGGGASGTVVSAVAAGGAGGTASGTPAESATGATWQGADGDWSIRFSVVAATGMLSGKGGDSQYGSGGAAIQVSGTGNAGRKYGGGGSGGADAAAANRTGGAGAVGIMVVEEWA